MNKKATYEQYLEMCNSSPWKDLEYGGQKVTPLTREEYEAEDSMTQETQ
jgi:hypothetical protein